MAIEQGQDRVRTPNEHRLYGRPVVFERVLLKQQLIKEGQLDKAAKIKIALCLEGGGQAVCTQYGAVKRMYELGMFHDGTIDLVIGASGGSVMASFGVIGKTEATDIFRQNCEGDFASFGNIKRYRRPVDFENFSERLRAFPLEREELQKVKSDILVVTTETDTGRQVIFDMKQEKDPYQILEASCNIPFVGNRQHVKIDGVAHSDGALGGIPWRIFDDYDITDGLILSCFPLEKTPLQKRMDDFLAQVGSRLPAIHNAALSSNKEGRRAKSEVFRRHCMEDPGDPRNYVIAAPERRDVGTYCMNWGKILHAMEDSYESATHHFIVAARNLAEKVEQDTVPVAYRRE